MKPEFKALIVTIIVSAFFASMFIYEQVAIFTLYCVLFLFVCAALFVGVYFPAWKYFLSLDKQNGEKHNE